jgi:hypothetical protein
MSALIIGLWRTVTGQPTAEALEADVPGNNNAWMVKNF